MNKKYIFFVFAFLCFAQAHAQFYKGQKAVGGEFLVFNTRNDYTQSKNAFTNQTGTGFGVALHAGKFLADKLYVHGIVNFNYTAGNRSSESNSTNGLAVEKTTYRVSTVGLGAGATRFFPASDIIGLYVKGQVTGGITSVHNKFFSSLHDSVLQDVTQNYPFYSINANIIPGIYINITPRWQLDFNIGNLYFVQTLTPERKGMIEKRVNASFGMDFNLFDFRLGVMRFLN